MNECDGYDIIFHGEVSNEKKMELYQTCKGLIYLNSEPEVTSHKIQEAMLSGAPIITTKLGALPEIVSDGVDGYCCDSPSEFLEAIKNVDKLDPGKTLEANRLRYSPEAVCQRYESFYEEVAGGKRW